MLTLLAGMAAIALAVYFIQIRSTKNQPHPRQVIQAVYRRLFVHGHALAVFSSPGQTPEEFSKALRQRLQRLESHNYNWLAGTAEGIAQLTVLYHEALFSPRQPGAREQALAQALWKRLHWRLWLARFVKAKK